MAQEEVAQEKTLNISIRVYRDPEDNLEYKADITVNGWTSTTVGLLDRKYIIDYINMNLQEALVHLGVLKRLKNEKRRKANLDMLLFNLERALAHALAYEIGQDNLVTKEVVCDRLWRAIGENECAYTICADFAKEDFEVCMENCKKEWCETTPNKRSKHPKSIPEGDANA